MIDSLVEIQEEMSKLKEYARIGQFFSVSKEICELQEEDIKRGEIEDIERNGYTFTDGIGNVSPELCLKIARHFGQNFSSAFQFRLGGAKGMLQVDRNLTGNSVQLRKSQIKFES